MWRSIGHSMEFVESGDIRTVRTVHNCASRYNYSLFPNVIEVLFFIFPTLERGYA
jgi:hypothetical protein